MERNENGFSGFNFTRGVTNRNRSCPGTGDIWQGNGNGSNNGNMGGNSNGNTNGNMNGSSNGNMIGGVTENGTNNNNNGSMYPGDCSGCSARQLAMVYSPHQCWRMLYSPDVALERGTLFEELDKPLEDGVNG